MTFCVLLRLWIVFSQNMFDSKTTSVKKTKLNTGRDEKKTNNKYTLQSELLTCLLRKTFWNFKKLPIVYENSFYSNNVRCTSWLYAEKYYENIINCCTVVIYLCFWLRPIKSLRVWVLPKAQLGSCRLSLVNSLLV